MENVENQIQEENTLIINPQIKEYLLETAKWGKFIAIVGYIGLGFLVIGGLFMMAGFSALNNIPNMPFNFGVFGILYIMMAVLYFFPITYLFRFSEKIKTGLNSSDQTTVDLAFSNLKSLYRFIGIMTIVILSIYALALVIIVPVTIFAASM